MLLFILMETKESLPRENWRFDQERLFLPSERFCLFLLSRKVLNFNIKSSFKISNLKITRSQPQIFDSISLQVIIPCSWLFGVIIDLPMFLVRNFDKKANHCALMWSEKWMGKAYSLTWFLLMALLPVCVIVALYSRVVYTLWFKDAEPNESKHGQQVRNNNESSKELW